MDKLRSIEYFMRVAEAKSLAAAAHVMEVSPSSVSKVIAGLERALGFSLFHRSTRRLSLTANGAAYLERCRHILRDLEEAETHGQQERRTPSGTVKVGMHPAFRNPFFAGIADLLNRYPLLRIETRITNSPAVLFDEGFDLLIRAGDLPDSTLVARPIGRLDMILAASPQYLERFGEPTHPSELERHRWALPARVDEFLGSSPHWEFVKGKERCAVTAQSYVTVRDSIGLTESAIGGVGVICVYTVALLRPIADRSVKALLTDWTVAGRSVYAVFPNSRAITPKAQVVMKFFASLVSSAANVSPRR